MGRGVGSAHTSETGELLGAMREPGPLFEALRKSSFRSRFRLREKEVRYLQRKGMESVLKEARMFVSTRLSAARPANDGKQTPMRNHPVFIAQHATATCCRGCLEQWHGIPRGRSLTGAEEEYIVSFIHRWLMENRPEASDQTDLMGRPPGSSRSPGLFDDSSICT